MADSRFLKFFNYILLVEGSYSNDRNDKGGETKYGITKEKARECGYKGSMKDFKKAMAEKIYEEKYYKAKKLDKIKNDKIQEKINIFLLIPLVFFSHIVKEINYSFFHLIEHIHP